MAEVAEEEPESGGRRAAAVVVNDNLGVVVHASQSQLTFKLVGRRKRVAASAILACDLLQVEENRARYVAVDELLPAAAPLQIPAKVDHPDIAMVDVFAQPVGLDQRSESHHEPITSPSRVEYARVVTEVHGAGPHLVDFLQRPCPVAPVRVLAGPIREVGLFRVAIYLGRVRRVPDHHRRATIRVDEDALVAGGVAGGGDHAHALGYLGVAVQKLEARPREVEPLRGYRLLLSRAPQLRALDVA